MIVIHFIIFPLQNANRMLAQYYYSSLISCIANLFFCLSIQVDDLMTRLDEKEERLRKTNRFVFSLTITVAPTEPHSQQLFFTMSL